MANVSRTLDDVFPVIAIGDPSPIGVRTADTHGANERDGGLAGTGPENSDPPGARAEVVQAVIEIVLRETPSAHCRQIVAEVIVPR